MNSFAPRRRALVVLCSAAWLTGCAPTVPPVTPEATVPVPTTWTERPSADANPVAPAAQPLWWRQVQDPALDGLIDAALAHNVDLQLAINRVLQARAQERMARAALVPHLNGSVAASRSRSVSAFGTPSLATTGEPMLTAGYEVDLFGRVSGQVDAARASVLSAEHARDASALSVAATAASGYFSLRALDFRLSVLRETVRTREASLRLTESQWRAGYSSRLNVDQARSELEATRQQVPTAELAIARQEHALALLSGLPPQAIARGRPLSQLALPPVNPAQPSELLRRRPDIAQAESALAASDAQLAVARAQFLPQLQLSASLGRVFSSPLDAPISIWSVGGSLLAPLFSGGQLEGNFDAATASRDAAALNYKKTVLTAFRDTEDALVTLERSAEQEAMLQAQRSAVADALRHATARYRAGYSAYLDQIDAERNLLSVDLSLIQARLDHLQAQVSLHQALGGGWEKATPTTTSGTAASS